MSKGSSTPREIDPAIKEKVWRAADEIAAKESTGLAGIKELMLSTGLSAAKIIPALRAWEEHHRPEREARQTAESKERAARAVENLGKIWQTEMEKVRAGIQAEAQKTLQRERAAWAAERKKPTEAFANSETAHFEQLQTLRARLDAREAENAALKERLQLSGLAV